MEIETARFLGSWNCCQSRSSRNLRIRAIVSCIPAPRVGRSGRVCQNADFSGAHAATPTEEVDDREQDDRAEERHEQRADAEVALVDGSGVKERREQEAAEERAHD